MLCIIARQSTIHGCLIWLIAMLAVVGESKLMGNGRIGGATSVAHTLSALDSAPPKIPIVILSASEISRHCEGLPEAIERVGILCSLIAMLAPLTRNELETLVMLNIAKHLHDSRNMRFFSLKASE